MMTIGAGGSVVVGRTPQIAVLAQAVLGLDIEERMAPVGLEQSFDIARRGDAGGEGALAGEFEPILAVGTGQPQHAKTGARSLLGMLARAEQPVDIEPAPAKAGVPMANPRAAASTRSLSGVRLAIAWCAGGMCSVAVVWCALAALRGWLATRSPW
jgi:hypothetical protein